MGGKQLPQNKHEGLSMEVNGQLQIQAFYSQRWSLLTLNEE